MNETRNQINNCHSAQTYRQKQTGVVTTERKIFFGKVEVEHDILQAVLAVAIFVIVGIVSAMLVFKSNHRVTDNIYADNATLLEVSSGEEMIGLLKENNLWQINSKGAVPPLLFASYPANIEEFATSIKKRVFFHTLLPVALTALNEVKKERLALQTILRKFPRGQRQQLTFADDYGVWGRVLTSHEIEFIVMLTRKYRTKSAEEIFKRVDLIPLSMIMAQGAIESSWATSRFASEGNNLFGIWTWDSNGLVPLDRDDNKDHRVARYDSILDSVRAYLLTLNRLPAYRHFRELRKSTRNPLKLADGLLNYSERRDVYVWEVKNFIQYNNLREYDKCFLVDRPIQYRDIKILKYTMRKGLNAG